MWPGLCPPITPWYSTPVAVTLAQAVEQIGAQLDAGAYLIALDAPPGYGKSTVLRALAATDRPVLYVPFPGGDDAALAALIEAAAGLEPHAPGVLTQVVPRQEPARLRWADRLALLRAALARTPENLLVLLDEPPSAASFRQEDRFFLDRAWELADVLTGARRPVVLAGSELTVRIGLEVGPQLPLVRDDELGAADAAVAMLGGRRLPALSPVVMQLVHALADTGLRLDRVPVAGFTPGRLVAFQLGELCQRSVPLRRVLARLAVMRFHFGEDWLDIAGLAALSVGERTVVERLLVRGADDALSLPAAVADSIIRERRTGSLAWALDEPEGAPHREAAGYHAARFATARDRGDVHAAVRHELEEIHHLTEAGDAAALLDRSLQFVEQYDALGRALSRRALAAERARAVGPAPEHLRRAAVTAYERALAHDDLDAYAHHYVAYNLDILGAEPRRADTEFQRARYLAPERLWYHSRYICFLVTRARVDEARAAWDKALADLEDAGALRFPGAHTALHAQVARHLLSRAHLDFAAEVLEDVPQEARVESWWPALRQLLVTTEEDRDERLVFPPTLPLDQRWGGPHLAGPEDPEVVDWHPARVLGRGTRSVVLLVGERLEDKETARSRRLAVDSIEAEWKVPPHQLSPGTFLELLTYEDDTKEMKLWDRARASFTNIPDLPRLFPYPDRYLRRAFA